MNALFQHEYLQNAVLAGFFSGALCGISGVFLVAMGASFLGICIAHAAFAGALLGLLTGLSPMACAMLFSLGAAAVIGPLSDRGALRPDTSIGILFSVMIGLAFLFMGLMPGGRPEALSLFWGAILTVSRGSVWLLACALAIVLLLITLFYRQIHVVACHRNVAAAAGIPAALYFYLMLSVSGVAISVSLPSVGGLLVYSLVVNPAAAAYQLTYNFKLLLFLAALFGIAACWLGLFLSFIFNAPAGAVIVLTSACIFALACVVSPKRKGASWRNRPPYPPGP
ncbi:MAG: metal ABC transporter permease [Candidatus Hydrogenedentes bacterium]|jgi:manganese/iron transport system permease protein|nr:metal ABC transporter permease [Candidatus Hydrogenedentota bacterium]